jgi:hypothetical protein
LKISCSLLFFLVSISSTFTSDADLGVTTIRGHNICHMVILGFCFGLFYLKCPFWIYMYVVESILLGPSKITICVIFSFEFMKVLGNKLKNKFKKEHSSGL